MKAEERLDQWYDDHDDALAINGLKMEANKAIALLRDFPPTDDMTPVATWVRLWSDWDKRRKAYLDGEGE